MIRWLAAAILPLALSACRPGGDAPEDDGVAAVSPVSPERAAALYAAHCAICHGEKGGGDGPRRGSLYRKPPDFRAADWRQHKSLADLRTAIRDGRPGTDMPAWKSLADDEVAGLAKHVLHLASGGRQPDR
jgi:high-affinity iron transporter